MEYTACLSKSFLDRWLCSNFLFWGLFDLARVLKRMQLWDLSLADFGKVITSTPLYHKLFCLSIKERIAFPCSVKKDKERTRRDYL